MANILEIIVSEVFIMFMVKYYVLVILIFIAALYSYDSFACGETTQEMLFKFQPHHVHHNIHKTKKVHHSGHVKKVIKTPIKAKKITTFKTLFKQAFEFIKNHYILVGISVLLIFSEVLELFIRRIQARIKEIARERSPPDK